MSKQNANVLYEYPVAKNLQNYNILNVFSCNIKKSRDKTTARQEGPIELLFLIN